MTFGSRFGRGLVAAMEDEGFDSEEVETGADSAEAAVAEATDISNDIEAATGEIDSASADAETLETITEKVEATEETGGLTPEAAEVVEVAVEAIYARLGIRSNPMPAMEGFNSSSSRVRATHIAVEDWKQKIKDIWKAIVNAFKRVYEWIMSFFKSIFDANAKLASRANALIAGLKDADGKTAKSKEISGGGFVNKLVTKGGWNVEKAVNSIGHAGFAKPINELINDIAKFNKEVDIKAATADEKVFNDYKIGVPTGLKQIKGEDAPENMKWYGFDDLPGNKRIAILYPSKEVSGKAAWENATQAKLVTSNSKLDVKKEKVDTLTVAQIRTIADAALANVKEITMSKSLSTSFEADLKNSIQDANNLAQQTPKDESIKERAQLVGKAFISFTNTTVKLYNTIYAHMTTTTQAGLDYAEKSLKEYTGEASTDTDKKKK